MKFVFSKSRFPMGGFGDRGSGLLSAKILQDLLFPDAEFMVDAEGLEILPYWEPTPDIIYNTTDQEHVRCVDRALTNAHVEQMKRMANNTGVIKFYTNQALWTIWNVDMDQIRRAIEWIKANVFIPSEKLSKLAERFGGCDTAIQVRTGDKFCVRKEKYIVNGDLVEIVAKLSEQNSVFFTSDNDILTKTMGEKTKALLNTNSSVHVELSHDSDNWGVHCDILVLLRCKTLYLSIHSNFAKFAIVYGNATNYYHIFQNGQLTKYEYNRKLLAKGEPVDKDSDIYIV